MTKFIIQGDTPLKGEIKVGGFKNAATVILAASLLTNEETTIENVPQIVDVVRMIELLRSLGARVTFSQSGSVVVHAKTITCANISEEAVKSMRSSALLIAPLFARCGKFMLPEPGGCVLGNRPLGTHMHALRELGMDIAERVDSAGKIFLDCKPSRLKGKTVVMSEFSVTATENVLMSAVLAEGVTIIRNAALEPHVIDLIKFLDSMGAKIEEKTGHTIKITGVKKLHGTHHRVIPDMLEAGTFCVAAALLGKGVVVHGLVLEHLDSVLAKMKEIGVKFETGKSEEKGEFIKILPSSKMKSFHLQTMIYPGFPTDLQPQFSLLATQAEGLSLIHDPLFDNRLEHIASFVKMGAHAIKCDPHRAVIYGPTQLHGYEFKSPDIRAGMALLIAGMFAHGETVIHNAEIIDRGYADIDTRLNALGAKIQRVSE